MRKLLTSLVFSLVTTMSVSAKSLNDFERDIAIELAMAGRFAAADQAYNGMCKRSHESAQRNIMPHYLSKVDALTKQGNDLPTTEQALPLDMHSDDFLGYYLNYVQHGIRKESIWVREIRDITENKATQFFRLMFWESFEDSLYEVMNSECELIRMNAFNFDLAIDDMRKGERAGAYFFTKHTISNLFDHIAYSKAEQIKFIERNTDTMSAATNLLYSFGKPGYPSLMYRHRHGESDFLYVDEFEKVRKTNPEESVDDRLTRMIENSPTMFSSAEKLFLYDLLEESYDDLGKNQIQGIKDMITAGHDSPDQCLAYTERYITERDIQTGHSYVAVMKKILKEEGINDGNRTIIAGFMLSSNPIELKHCSN